MGVLHGEIYQLRRYFFSGDAQVGDGNR
jgi:hypothetical protein